MSRDSAEAIGLSCLSWLVGNEELLPVFLGATGASGTDLRDSAADPAFLGSVLDFVLMDDAWLVAFCAATGHPPEAPMMARAMLPGGEVTHWT